MTSFGNLMARIIGHEYAAAAITTSRAAPVPPAESVDGAREYAASIAGGP